MLIWKHTQHEDLALRRAMSALYESYLDLISRFEPVPQEYKPRVPSIFEVIEQIKQAFVRKKLHADKAATVLKRLPNSRSIMSGLGFFSQSKTDMRNAP